MLWRVGIGSRSGLSGGRALSLLLLVMLPPVAASAGLVAHWRADGDYLDASGNGHHGTPTNAPGFTTGPFGQAFSFDGNLAQNVSVPDHPAFDFGTGDFSVVFWARPDQNVGSGHGMVAKDSFGLEPTYRGWLFNEADALGGLGFQTRRLGVADTSARTPTRITPGTWEHLAAVRSGGTLTLYKNAAPVASASESSATDVSNGAPLTIGSLYPTPSPQYFSGDIDDVAVFDHALSEDEISWIASNGVPADEIVLLNPSLRVEIRRDNGAIAAVDFLSFFYSGPTPTSDWGLQLGTDTGTFVHNSTTGVTEQVVTVDQPDSHTARVSGSYSGIIPFVRTYELDPLEPVLRVETEFFGLPSVTFHISYFDTFNPDPLHPESTETFNDRYAAAGHRIAVAAASATGTSAGPPSDTVVITTDDPAATLASGGPYRIDSGALLNDFFADPADGDGSFADQGTHVGIRFTLPAGGTRVFVWEQAYGVTPAFALADLGLPAAQVPTLGVTALVLASGILLAAARRALATRR